ncbi:PREDICTED: tRNA pseudouridine synthase A isoform X2 [Prunus mume]|uniref:tRNA pseudouridine synthase n=1 Tax=Prunus mume TaxID=102107 RepID=A0ABM1LKY6_PRUMU|nr:PREDICTED: tRNA pseudouridine synthase A isoform X2 [Prunus mume]
MENKVLIQYNHTDPCSFARWTTKECFQFMSARPWQQVMDFYSDVVKDRKPLSALLGKACLSKSNIYNRLESLPPSQDKGGRWARLTFKIVVSYHGGSFDGWQRQPGLNTVQSVVEKSLGKFVDERKAQMLKDKGLPLEGAALVAGRTDKGVTAVHQILGERMSNLKILQMPSIVQHQENSGSYPLLRGPPTECFLYHARAKESKLPCSEHEKGRRVMCIELVANRFLRRMVRVLVATSIREAAAGADEDALLKLMDATCRRATAPPAPPDGLCLVDVGYEEFDPQDCLILKE